MSDEEAYRFFYPDKYVNEIMYGEPDYEYVHKEGGEKPIGVSGLRNTSWVVIDYADVMVHVFMPEEREFYDLEHLWEDAPINRLPNID